MFASLLAAWVVCAPGQPIAVTALDGSPHRPLAEAKGKPVAFVFIAHDCPICNAYAPELARIATEYAKRGLAVELVYAEPGLSLEAARAHAKAYAYTRFKVFLDPKGALAKACEVNITP